MKIMKAVAETVRQETFQGRDFTVVPVIAIIEGVLQAANSPQPELVKASEFDPASWNGRPITFGHPAVGNALVSASASPEIFEEVAVGTIFNATIVDGTKLRVEAWIDNEKVESQSEEAIAAFNKLKAGESVEVSTGYFADSITESGKFNGEPFEAIQSDIKPDHLAILLGSDIGACSLEDGCGTNRMNDALFSQIINNASIEISTAELISGVSFYGFDKHDPEEDEEEKKKKSKKNQDEEDEEEDEDEDEDKKKENRSLSEILKHCQLKDNGEISDMDIRSAISSALESNGESFWAIVAVFQKHFVFEKDFGTLERRDFSIADDGTVTIKNEGVSVRPVTEFVPVNVNQSEEMKSMKTKDEMIGDLIANDATQFTEADHEFLAGLDEGKLSILAPIEVSSEEEEKEGEKEKVKAEGGAPDETKEEEMKDPQTTEEFIAAAPPEIKEVLNQGIKMHKEHRDSLTKMIIANSKFSEEDLKAFSMENLEKLADSSAPADYSLKAGPTSNLGTENDNNVPKPIEIWPKNGTQQQQQAS